MATIARPQMQHDLHQDTDAQFTRGVWQVVLDIPHGRVLTYGEVARLAGQSRGARKVAGAMRRAPNAMDLPWHRVINAQGKISFPDDSSAFKQQKHMLQNEGVVFLNGCVDLDHFGYQGAVDQLIWGGMNAEPVTDH